MRTGCPPDGRWSAGGRRSAAAVGTCRRAARGRPSSAQHRYMLHILPALLRAPLVAGLVLGGDQRVRAAPPFGREVKIACCGPNASLDMAPPALDRLQAPLRLMGIDQEHAELAAVGACA